MELSLTAIADKNLAVSKVEVSDAVFGVEYKEALIHQVITAYRASARSGNSAQKTRAEVSGGGAKPWKQKGTGRARAGTSRGPIWRGGGVTFAAKPTSYKQKVNKKMFGGAMRSIVSELVRQDRLVVVDDFTVADHKTRSLLSELRKMSLTDVLIVTSEMNANLYLAARNLWNVDVRDAAGIDPVSLIGFEKVMVTLSALKKIEEMLV